jgi:hypothetical protein
MFGQIDTLCPNVNIVNDQPIEPGSYEAFYSVLSQGTVAQQSDVTMDAGEFVELGAGFTVELTATFHAFIEGCSQDCEESLPLCEGDPCGPLDGQQDVEGRLFANNQILVTYHNDIALNPIDPIMIKAYLDNNAGVANVETTLTECTCGANILIYESRIPINVEGTIIQSNTSGGPNEEGIYFGANYFLEADMDNPSATNGSLGMDQSALNSLANNNNAPIVAFLDTGIDYHLLPNNILLNQPSPCFGGQDAFGWNFVDNNNDIFDNRGHGTAVVMSYLNTLQNEGIPFDQQRILPVKVLDDCGRGTMFSVICGMYYAREKGAEIINNSWGLYENEFQLQQTVIDLADNQGITMVCSAGNRQEDLRLTEHFPSGYSNTFNRILPNGSQFLSPGLVKVFEVGGLCHGIMDPPITTGPVPFYPASNYRSYMWVEPAIDVQDLINNNSTIPITPPISCGISGTSYATPQLTAGVMDFRLTNGSVPTQLDMIPIGRNVSSTFAHYSYTQR